MIEGYGKVLYDKRERMIKLNSRGLFLKIKNFDLTIQKTLPNEIGPGRYYVCIYDGCYLHTNKSLIKLILDVILEFRSSKNIVGY